MISIVCLNHVTQVCVAVRIAVCRHFSTQHDQMDPWPNQMYVAVFVAVCIAVCVAVCVAV